MVCRSDFNSMILFWKFRHGMIDAKMDGIPYKNETFKRNMHININDSLINKTLNTHNYRKLPKICTIRVEYKQNGMLQFE